MSETKCECPARKALEKAVAALRYYLGADVAAEAIKATGAEAALSAPCPCEGLREQFSEAAVQSERSRQFTVAAQRQTELIAVELEKQAARADAAEAERDQLRAKLEAQANQ